MGEGLLKRLLPDATVSSAGLLALDGSLPDPTAVRLLSDYGVDISLHRARRLSPLIMASADLVLVAESAQRLDLERQYVAARGKVFRIGEFDGSDIADPFQLEPTHYQRALSGIEAGLLQWAKQIARIATRNAE